VHSGNLYGGVETLMVTLARERQLCPMMQPHFALCFGGRLREELVDAGVPIYDLGNTRVSRPFSVWRARRSLNDLLLREGFDMAICHSAWTQALFGGVVRAQGLPLVFWLHGPANGHHWLERWARRTKPEFALCNSRFTAATISNLYPQVRAEVIYCPVSSPNNSYSTSDLVKTREELNTPVDAVVIIQVSRMEEGKGHHLHLEALRLMNNQPDWICWMVGGAQRPDEAHYLETIKKQAIDFGLIPRLRFVGQRSDVPRLLAASDIYCQPNTGPEAFGITLIEAMYARLPVVTTDIGGAKEIVDESCGHLVRLDDSSAIAHSLGQLINNQNLREHLGQNGLLRAQLISDPATQMRRLSELLVTHLSNKVAA
jgi:glycosyltransferase involved in cell wall biosynthesis